MLTVLTWWWRQPNGRTKYTAEHVNIWASMVRRNLTLPHRIACVTAHPEGIDPSVQIITPTGEFEDVRLPTWGEKMPQCLRRIAMFRPDAAAIFGERFVSMDLDCVIYDSLDPLFDSREDFVMYRGTAANRPYNGSMLMMTAGCRSKVYTEFDPTAAAQASRDYIGSDQAWISHVLGPGEATWSIGDGVYWQTKRGRQPGFVEPRVIFFPGPMKPWDVTDDYEIVSRYRRNLGGRCLVLGYDGSVWDDLARVDLTGIDHVIAAPEAAVYWPGKLYGIARTDKEADYMAHLAGFDEVIFCGRSKDTF